MTQRTEENIARVEMLAEIKEERTRIISKEIARLEDERNALLQKVQWKQAQIKAERKKLKALASSPSFMF